MTTEQNLQSAVRRDKITSKQGILQGLFARWFDAFVYNQIWEDPRVDLQALELDGESRILTISSGGCNALNYLVEGPESVTAVDLNRYHIYLLRLKQAAIRHLPGYQEFFQMFGMGRHPGNVANYFEYIAPNLDEDARRFWESNGFFGSLLHGKRIKFFAKGGLYEHSRNGYFLRFFHSIARLHGCRPEAMLAAVTPDEQRESYERNVSPFFDTFLIRTLGKMPVTMFGLGIPPQQYEELKKDLAEGGSVIDIYRERAERLACGYDITDNYFAWQAFGRRYDTANGKALPEYLKEENFDRLRANIGKLTAEVGSVTDRIKASSVGAFNRFVFLDAQDWMDAAVMTDLWQAVVDRSVSGARIIFRTAGALSPLGKNLPPDLLSRFIYHKDQSAELFKQDRASIYGGFHLYELK